MNEHFTKYQDSVRKDVERVIGVLQAKWKIVKNLVCQRDLGTIDNIIMACIIMYNMIVEDEQGLRWSLLKIGGFYKKIQSLPLLLEACN